MLSYFLTENTSVDLTFGGKKFRFEPVEFYIATNSWWGVLETGDQKDTEALKAAAASGRIYEITAEDYSKYVAKKKNASSLITSIPLRSPLETPSDQAPAAPAADTALPKKVVSTMEDVIAPRATKRK